MLYQLSSQQLTVKIELFSNNLFEISIDILNECLAILIELEYTENEEEEENIVLPTNINDNSQGMKVEGEQGMKVEGNNNDQSLSKSQTKVLHLFISYLIFI